MPRRIRIFQGEDRDTRYNTLVGEFVIEGLAEVPAGNQILVRLELDLNGILKVTAIERATGLAKHVVIDNAMERFRLRQRSDALERLEAVFDNLAVRRRALDRARGPGPGSRTLRSRPNQDAALPGVRQATLSAHALIAKAKGLLPAANAEDAEELRAMLTDLEAALDRGVEDDIRAVSREVEEIVFYLEDV